MKEYAHRYFTDAKKKREKAKESKNNNVENSFAKENKSESKTLSGYKSPDQTSSYKVIEDSDVRRKMRQLKREKDLDQFIDNIRVGEARTRGAYQGGVVQHTWLGSDASTAIFYIVDHRTRTVTIVALSEHFNGNKYRTIAGAYKYKEWKK